MTLDLAAAVGFVGSGAFVQPLHVMVPFYCRLWSPVVRGLCLLFAVPFAASAATPTAADAAAERHARIAAVFRPFQTNRAALSPDGRHLAYELRRDEKLFLTIVNVERNEAVELPLIEDRPIPVSGVSEKVPTHLTYLAWATANRVIATVQDELLIAVDADGRNFRTLLDSRKLEWVTQSARALSANMAPRSPLLPGYDVSSAKFTDSSAPRGLQYEQAQRDADWVRQINPAAGAFIGPDDPLDQVEPRALSIHTDLGDPAQASLFNSGSAAGAVPTWRAFVADLLDHEPNEVLVEVRGRASPWDDGPQLEEYPAVNAHNVITGLCRVDLRNGKIRWSDSDFARSRLIADRAGKPRLALKHFSTERTFEIMRRPGARRQSFDELLAGANLPAAEVTPENYFAARTIPLGFGYDPQILYYATNHERDTYGIYAFDLSSGKPTEVAIEHEVLDLVDFNEPIPEGVLVFDRHRRALAGIRVQALRPETLWLDPELATVQQALANLAPGLDFEILEWAEDRSRFLILASNTSQPGAYYLYEPRSGALREYVQRAPWIGSTHTTTPFNYTTPSGVTLPGYFTYPRDQRIDPVPVIVYCHDGPWSRDRPGYDRGVQALASMGFAVLQVNYRGSAGFGRAHLEALREADERVAINDLLAALDWIQETHAVSRRRVAILGNGFGGYLALRATQLHPERFRCAVGINTPADLPRWLNYPFRPMAFQRDVRAAYFNWGSEQLRASSLTHQPEAFQRPLLIVQAEGDTVVPDSQARALQRALRGSEVEPEIFYLNAEGHSRWLPGSAVRVFERLEDFFRENIFEYTVEAGETEVIAQLPPR